MVVGKESESGSFVVVIFRIREVPACEKRDSKRWGNLMMQKKERTSVKTMTLSNNEKGMMDNKRWEDSEH